MPGKTDANNVADGAKFLFKGTVQKLNASTLAQVPRNEPTAIVHVDEILHAPPVLAKTLGKEITVKLAKGAKPRVGEQVLFHANGWLFGDSVAVESLKQEKPAQTKTMLAERASDPARNLANRELQDRVADAEMVVEGEVSSVHLPQAESFAATRAAQSAKPVSEHDPKWREAVINVGAVHKGNPGMKQVVVRFPSSTDVQWHRAPKFRAGDRGVWLLHTPKGPAAADPAAKRTGRSELAMAATAVPGATVYTALSPMDFQPANKLDAVAPVIRTAVASFAPPTPERVRQIEAKAVRKVRQSARARKAPAETAKNS
jgi:hypothetical protein